MLLYRGLAAWHTIHRLVEPHLFELTGQDSAILEQLRTNPEAVLSIASTPSLEEPTILTELPEEAFRAGGTLEDLLERMALDPEYMAELTKLAAVETALVADALKNNPEYATDSSELQELQAILDGLPPGTPEYAEALHELKSYRIAVSERIVNDPDYADTVQVLDRKFNELLKHAFENPEYEGLVEKLKRMEDLQQIQAEEVSSRFMEGSEDPIAEGSEDLITAEVAPDPGTAEGTPDLVTGLTDIDINGDLLDVDLPPV